MNTLLLKGYVKLHQLKDEQLGAALAEYGLLVGLIAAVCVVAITALGTKISTIFSIIAVDIGAA